MGSFYALSCKNACRINSGVRRTGPSLWPLSRERASCMACFPRTSPLEFGNNRSLYAQAFRWRRLCSGRSRRSLQLCQYSRARARPGVSTALSQSFTSNPPPFRAIASAPLGQLRGDPFSGATHRQASIARSRRIKCNAFLVALVSFSMRSITQARMGP